MTLSLINHYANQIKLIMRNRATSARTNMTKQAARVTAALTLLLGAQTARAVGVQGLMTNWTTSVNSIIQFVSVACLLAGVAGIAFGCKLIYDKSNERADVKNGHIVAAFVGGSFLCIIWVIVTILVESSGGSSSNIGAGRP